MESRNIDEKHLKFGIDGGGGFLKVCLSIQSDTDYDLIENEKKCIRQSYSDGIRAKKSKNSSVKKLFILALAPSSQENYVNVFQLWEALGINDFKGTIATDLKLANIIVGIMSHASSFPCCWCYADKYNLGNDGELRYIGSGLKNYMDWCDAGSSPKDAKKFKNCIHLPIIQTSNDQLILDLIPPPELHLLLGVVNTIFSNMLEEFEEDANKWAKNCSVQRERTHGSPSFKGNSCKILLNKVDLLRSTCSVGCLKYADAFSSFNKVVQACFTINLDPKFAVYIDEFKDKYLNLKISVTPKLHAVFFHVKQFCIKHQKGLGFFSEQAMEAVHYDFSMTWAKYKVSRNNPDYIQKLLRAVCEYNSQHV